MIGHSVENRELRVYTLAIARPAPTPRSRRCTSTATSTATRSRAARPCLYLIWYLAENHGAQRERHASCRRTAPFYVVPTVNPDGRAYWFNGAEHANSSRSGKSPLDDDRDGLVDEDGYDDLDGDGQITQMRKHGPGEGTLQAHARRPARLLVPRQAAASAGECEMLGLEGIDNDGDGRGQRGRPRRLRHEPQLAGRLAARAHPGRRRALSRSAGPRRAPVAAFVLDHPNIAAVQAFHNAGGMILRGPGAAEPSGRVPAPTTRGRTTSIGRDGEKMIPFYRNMVIWQRPVQRPRRLRRLDLRGPRASSRSPTSSGTTTSAAEDPDGQNAGDGPSEGDQLFDDDACCSAPGFVALAPVEHPLYGEIEIGGFIKDVGRVPPTFLIEEMLHRNALFCI